MAHRVTKVLSFAYGHRLMNYQGPCKNLHGHNARLEIVLETKELNALGMVVDFGEIKGKIKKWVDENLDHRMLVARKDPGYKALQKLDPTVVALDFNPTAENIAKLIFDRVSQMGFPVAEVRLWETDTSRASFRR